MTCAVEGGFEKVSGVEEAFLIGVPFELRCEDKSEGENSRQREQHVESWDRRKYNQISTRLPK